MRIAILGGGVIDVAAAYELARCDTHDITVYNAADDVATEASAVNASMIATSYCYAWATPKTPAILLKSLYRDDQVFRMRPRSDAAFWKWIGLFLRQCNSCAATANTLRKYDLCRYSLQRLHLLAEETGIDYEQHRR